MKSRKGFKASLLALSVGMSMGAYATTITENSVTAGTGTPGSVNGTNIDIMTAGTWGDINIGHQRNTDFINLNSYDSVRINTDNVTTTADIDVNTTARNNVNTTANNTVTTTARNVDTTARNDINTTARNNVNTTALNVGTTARNVTTNAITNVVTNARNVTNSASNTITTSGRNVTTTARNNVNTTANNNVLTSAGNNVEIIVDSNANGSGEFVVSKNVKNGTGAINTQELIQVDLNERNRTFIDMNSTTPSQVFTPNSGIVGDDRFAALYKDGSGVEYYEINDGLGNNASKDASQPSTYRITKNAASESILVLHPVADKTKSRFINGGTAEGLRTGNLRTTSEINKLSADNLLYKDSIKTIESIETKLAVTDANATTISHPAIKLDDGNYSETTSKILTGRLDEDNKSFYGVHSSKIDAKYAADSTFISGTEADTKLTSDGLIVSATATDASGKKTTKITEVTASSISTPELVVEEKANIKTLNVAEDATINSLTVNEKAHLKKDLQVDGRATLNKLTVNDLATFNKGIVVNNVTSNLVVTSKGTPATVPTFGADTNADGRPDTLLQDRILVDQVIETSTAQRYNELNLTYTTLESSGERTTTDKYIADITYDANGVAHYGPNTSLGQVVTNNLTVNAEDTIIVGKEKAGDTTALTVRRTDATGSNSTVVTANSISTTGTIDAKALVVDGRNLGQEITDLDQKVNAEVTRLDTEIVNVNKRVDDVVTSVTNLENKVDTEVAAVNGRVDAVETSVADLDTKVTNEVTRLDQAIANSTSDVKAYADAGDVKTLADANAYTDIGLTAATEDRAAIRTELVAGDVKTLADANAYTDTGLTAATNDRATIRTELVAGDAATLIEAQSYSDAKATETLTTARTELAAGDAKTLTDANTYTDKAIATVVTNVNNGLNNISKRLDEVEETAYRGTAIALAAAQQVPNIKAGQFAVFGGVGHYEGESAVALGGVAALADGRTSISAALGTAGSEIGGRVGVAYVFGAK